MTDRCTCCKREWSLIILASGRSASSQGRRDDGVCPACWQHAPFAQQRDSDHLGWWQGLLTQARTEAATVQEDLENQIAATRAQLEAEVQARPERIVEKWVNAELVQAAEADRATAYRSRERAWQGLCEIRLRHREDTGGRCRCGARRDQCAEAKIVDGYPGIVAWEAEQIARLRNHKSYRLPANHPLVLDPRLPANWNDGPPSDVPSDTA